MSRITGWAAAGAVLMLAGAAHAGGPDDGDRPAYARPGQCFAKVKTAEVYETFPERQLVQPERIERRLVPAEFEMRDRRVVVRPASVEHYPVPSTYRTVTATVVVQPPSYRTEVIPAVYESVARQVLVREARTVWRPGRSLPVYGQAYPQPYGYAPDGYGAGWRGQTQVTPTGEVLCLVVEPAVYRTVVEQVMRTPERVIQVPVPPVTQLQSRQVIDRPGYDAAREIPAEYGVVHERVVVRPEHEESYTVPPVYRTVESRRLVSAARTEWREIACAAPPPPPPPMMMAPLPCGERCAPPPPPMHREMRPVPPMERPHARVHRRLMMRPTEPCQVCAPARTAAPAPSRAEPPRMDMAASGRPMVSRLQAALAGRGYYKGPVDGAYTAPTRDALVRFQRDKGFGGQGELTRETARELGLAR